MTKIKIAIIGVGVMGKLHAKDIHALENAELCAVCDIKPDRANKYAKIYGVPAFYDYQEMLAQADIDAVLIATPHYDHPTIAMDAFERGIHVLTEKSFPAKLKTLFTPATQNASVPFMKTALPNLPVA